MAQSAHLLLRIVASSAVTANYAGKIVRDVMSKGDLGIVEKVCYLANTLLYCNLDISRNVFWLQDCRTFKNSLVNVFNALVV